MDLSKVKEKLGDDEMFAELQSYVEGLEGKLKTVRKKADSETERAGKLSDAQAKLLEKLGIETPDDIESLPDAKGQAEAVKQFEAKLKRAEKELNDSRAERDALNSKYRETLSKAALAKALSKYEFIDRDVVGHFISSRVQWDGDELRYHNDDGGLVSLDDGVATFAKTRTGLLKQQGAGGSGYTQNAGSGKGDKPWKDMTLTERGELFRKDPAHYQQLKSQATN